MTVQFADHDRVFDRVVSTLPTPVMSRMCPELSTNRESAVRRRTLSRHRVCFGTAVEKSVAVLRHEYH